MDAAGKTVAIRPAGRVASVLLFLGKDDLSRRYLPALENLANSPAYANAAFFSLDPDNGGRLIPPSGTRGSLTWVTDPLGSALPRFAVTHVPSVWIFDAMGVVRYAGPLDPPKAAQDASAAMLRQSLLAIMNGRPAPPLIAPFGTPVDKLQPR